MALLDDLSSTLPDGNVLQVNIGLHWTAVVSESVNDLACGLASTVSKGHDHHAQPDIMDAGKLEFVNCQTLVTYAQSDNPLMRSVGIATINSLIPRQDQLLLERNAEQLIGFHGAEKNVVVVGRFPFVPRVKKQVRKLTVIEIEPNPGEVSQAAARFVIPEGEVVAITGMSLINGTFESLIDLCSPEAFVIVLGPSAPLSPILFDYGVDVICGAIVEDIAPVLRAIRHGANFHQVHRAGVRLVCMEQG